MIQIDNIKIRYLYTIIGNIFRASIFVIIGVSLARILGVKKYGDLAFLISTFMALKQLVDLGTSSAFFTFLSKKQQSLRFVLNFWIFFIAKYVVVILLILFILPSELFNLIWHSQSKDIVFLVFFSTIMQFDFWVNAIQMLDSDRKTILGQGLYIACLLLQLLLIYFLHLIGPFKIQQYLMINALLWFSFSIFAILLYKPKLEEEKINFGISKYLIYCLPLVPVYLINFVTDFSDKWMLQYFSGPEQQAFFSISQQVASVSMLFVSSGVRIFWKEIAEASHKENNFKLKEIYFKAKINFFNITVFIAASLFPYTRDLIYLIYGADYISAYIALALLLCSAVHQSIGQIESTFLMATSNTSVGLMTALFFSIFGPLFLYILLAGKLSFTLGGISGSEFLAVKTIAIQIITVNILGFLIAKKYKWEFSWKYQIKIPLALFSISALVKFFILNLRITSPIIEISFGVFVYALIIFCLYKYKNKWMSY